MLSRTALALAVLALLAGCSQTPEAIVGRAAATMNALNNDKLDKAFAEGTTLVVRYKSIPVGNFSDDELVRLTSAGLCTLDGVKSIFDQGARIRLEIPRGQDFLKIRIDGCKGGQAIAAAVGDQSKSSAQWPTKASIAR